MLSNHPLYRETFRAAKLFSASRYLPQMFPMHLCFAETCVATDRYYDIGLDNQIVTETAYSWEECQAYCLGNDECAAWNFREAEHPTKPNTCVLGRGVTGTETASTTHHSCDQRECVLCGKSKGPIINYVTVTWGGEGGKVCDSQYGPSSTSPCQREQPDISTTHHSCNQRECVLCGKSNASSGLCDVLEVLYKIVLDFVKTPGHGKTACVLFWPLTFAQDSVGFYPDYRSWKDNLCNVLVLTNLAIYY